MIAARRFPIQQETRTVGWGATVAIQRNKSFTVPWSVAEEAYKVYAARYGTQQSLDRLAERGGFGARELLWLLSGGKDDQLL